MMAIAYPLALPAVADDIAPIVTMGWSARAVVGVSESPFSLAQQVQVHPGQAWGPITVSVAPMRVAAAAEWIGWLLSLNGREGTFLLGDPTLEVPRGTIGAAGIVIAGAHAVRARTITLAGLSAGATVLTGDYLQLGAGATARLHRVLRPATAAADGTVTVEIWPGLRADLAGGEEVTTRSCVGRFRLSSNTMEWDIQTAAIFGLDFKASEVLP
ncbi:MAG: hypothetical protein RLZZ501_1433 [Pseudomonadota bacterium]|jgi:hypothetical protein